jgi:hypothetical protein
LVKHELSHRAKGERGPPPEDLADPTLRRAGELAGPIGCWPALEPVAPPIAADANARASLEDIVPMLVRKIAWFGDGRRGSVRVELAAGELAGATLLVHAHDGRVNVELCAVSDVDTEGWRTRIAERLAARGIAVDGIEVR